MFALGMKLAYVLDNFHHHLSGTTTLGANHLFVCVAVDLGLSRVECLVCDIRNWSRICFAQEGYAPPAGVTATRQTGHSSSAASIMPDFHACYDLNESSEIVFSKLKCRFGRQVLDIRLKPFMAW